MKNVINFAEARKKQEERNEELKELIQESDIIIAKHFALNAARDIVTALHDMGIDVANDPKSILEIMSTMEIIKALIFRSIGETHPFQTVSERMWEDMELDHDELLHTFLEDMYEVDDEE
jgi:uncharacterized protein YutE (UPF0331/DUF86 family)